MSFDLASKQPLIPFIYFIVTRQRKSVKRHTQVNILTDFHYLKIDVQERLLVVSRQVMYNFPIICIAFYFHCKTVFTLLFSAVLYRSYLSILLKQQQNYWFDCMITYLTPLSQQVVMACTQMCWRCFDVIKRESILIETIWFSSFHAKIQVPQTAENKLKDLTKSICSGIIQSMLYNTHLNSILTKSFRCFFICLITKL